MTASAPTGVVLRTTPLRESDLLVVLYTDAYGRVSAVARGARRSKLRFAGALSVLVLGRYQLTRRAHRDLWSLEAGEVVREWTQLSHDVVAVAHASYVIELVGSLLPPEAPDPQALDLVIALWDSLAAAGPSPSALRAVELELLDVVGHRPSIDACAACGNSELATGAVFNPTRGGAICRRCASTSRGPSVRPLDSATREYLQAVRELAAPANARAADIDPRFTPADRIHARDAMLAMIGTLVARPLRSVEYIAKLGTAVRAAGPGGNS